MTKEEFEISKMELELESLKIKLDKERKDLKPSWGSKFFNQTTKTVSLGVAFVSLLAGIWSLVIPARNYFNERQKQLHYNLSKEMIDLANNLRIDSASLQQESVLLLSYYDMNAMPILLYQLENFSNSIEKTMVDHVIKTISLVYMRNQKGVTNEIIYYFTNIFRQTDTERKWDERKYNSLLNYGELINKITFRDKDRRRILSMISQMQEDVAKESGLSEKMGGFNDLLDDFK
jgi:hypothetical protein